MGLFVEQKQELQSLLKDIGKIEARLNRIEKVIVKVDINEALRLTSESNALMIKKASLENRYYRLSSQDYRNRQNARYEPTYQIAPMR